MVALWRRAEWRPTRQCGIVLMEGRGRSMGMAIEDLLRLAWRADGDGKPGLRDALLTLAVVDSGTENAVLAERCRRLLIARRPEHWFATSPTLGQALAHTKVANAVERLRLTFPPVRVERLLVRYSVLSGPYTGRTASLAQVLDDLSLTPDSKTASARRQAVSRSARFGRHDHTLWHRRPRLRALPTAPTPMVRSPRFISPSFSRWPSCSIPSSNPPRARTARPLDRLQPALLTLRLANLRQSRSNGRSDGFAPRGAWA